MAATATPSLLDKLACHTRHSSPDNSATIAATAAPSLLDKLACLLADDTHSQTHWIDLSEQYTKAVDIATVSPTMVSSYITLSVNPASLRPTSAVLNTPELLERILLHLDE